MKNGRNAALNGGRGSGQTVRRITELYENKIADLKANFDLAIEGRDIKIMELEKENAGLKERLELLNLNANIAVRDLKDLLAKAIELLNEFMRISKASDEDFEHDYSELIGETEQFMEKVK